MLQQVVERIEKHTAQKKTGAHITNKGDCSYYDKKSKPPGYPGHQAINTIENYIDYIGSHCYRA